MGLTSSCSCNVPSCNRSWSRHPVLEVKCRTCGQDVGSPCKRPSGHDVMAEHGRYHTERYYDSLDEGHFGECPIDRCPESSAESQERKRKEGQGDLVGNENETTTQQKLPV